MRTPQFWQHNDWRSTLLLPASALYWVGARISRYLATPQRAPLPVISVGNVTVGGAGKTPTVLALIPLLREMQHVPHIISRGYGGMPHTAHRVTASDDWRMVGDEPLLLAAAAPTWVGAQRPASAYAAHAAGATVVVADDALQHHRLHKDISLLVIDGAYGIGNGRLLPAGPLREPLSAAVARCDAVVMIGDDTQQLGARITKPIFRARVETTGDTSWLYDAAVIAFAGLARPQKFFDGLRVLGASLLSWHSFADHHAYARDEVEALLAQAKQHQAVLVTTAKDAVKLAPDLRAQVRVLDIALRWQDEAALRQWLGERLRPA